MHLQSVSFRFRTETSVQILILEVCYLAVPTLKPFLTAVVHFLPLSHPAFWQPNQPDQSWVQVSDCNTTYATVTTHLHHIWRKGSDLSHFFTCCVNVMWPNCRRVSKNKASFTQQVKVAQIWFSNQIRYFYFKLSDKVSLPWIWYVSDFSTYWNGPNRNWKDQIQWVFCRLHRLTNTPVSHMMDQIWFGPLLPAVWTQPKYHFVCIQ